MTRVRAPSAGRGRRKSSPARTPPSRARPIRASRCARSTRRTPCGACPASAFAGSVAPIRSRHLRIASGASSAMTMARPRRHEVGQLAEERPLAMHVVEALGLGLGQVHQAQRADGEALVFDALENAAGEAALDGVGLDDGERTFHRGTQASEAEQAQGLRDSKARRYGHGLAEAFHDLVEHGLRRAGALGGRATRAARRRGSAG